MPELREPEDDEIDYDALLDEEEPVEREIAPEARLGAAEDEWQRRDLLWLLLITCVAGALRLYRIDEWSFWIDEIFTLRDGVLLDMEQFWNSVASERPVQYLLVRWFQEVLPGSDEGSFRIIFAFFGIASVPLMAVVVRRMFGAGPALLSAAILTLSPWHVYWSQTVRGYSIVLFLGLASLYFFWLGSERGRGRYLLLSLALAALAMLTHPSSVFFVFAFVVYLFALRIGVAAWPKNFGVWALFCFSLPLVFGALWNAEGLLSAFDSYLRSKADVVTLPHLANTTVFFVRVPVIVAAVGGLIFLWYQRSRTGLLLALYIAVPMLSLSVASFFVRVSAQYAFFTLPAWCILSGYGGWEIVRRLELKAFGYHFVRLLPIAMILFELATQLHLYYHYRHGERPRWREAADYVLAHLGPDDLVASTNVPCIEWYLNPSDPKVVTGVRQPDGRHVHGITDWSLERGDLPLWVREADASGARVWVVTTQPLFQEMDPQKVWDTWLRARFQQVRRLPNWVGPKDMTVFVYRYEGQGQPEQRGEKR
ncbi:MAG: hypothetical protein CSA62_06905 [Planctomycetota bacterium]|nr:MAG: hypothetical protein CSA62_06905 [Planctomycetota bacterium]